jgi:hypothetical protein
MPEEQPIIEPLPFRVREDLNGQIFYIGESYQFVHRAGLEQHHVTVSKDHDANHNDRATKF